MEYLVISMIILAGVTYVPRVIPLMINKEIKSAYVKSVLYYMPYSVLGAMTFPAVFYSTGNIKASVIGTVVAIVLAYMEQSLIRVAIGSVGVVYILNILM